MHSAARFLTTTLAALVLTLPTACERPAPPQSTGNAPATSQSETNAADEYRALHAAMTDDLLTHSGNATPNLTPEAAQALADAKPIIDRLVWATNLSRCDWGVDTSAGYEAAIDAVLPDQGRLRALARLLRADAYRALQQGDSATAAADTAAIINLATHAGDELLIQTLTADGLLMVATDLITTHAASWSAEDRDTLRLALVKVDPDDPFGTSAALAREREHAATEGFEPIDENLLNQGQQKIREQLLAARRAVG